MIDHDAKPKAHSAESVLTAGLGLDAEAVQCYLYALLDEAKRRGGMFPQTSDEQDSDSDAVHRVCGMVRWYAERGEPRPNAVADLHAVRARNMIPNACDEGPPIGGTSRSTGCAANGNYEERTGK